MVLSPTRIPTAIYTTGLLLVPLVIGSSAVLEALSRPAWPVPGPGILPLLLVALIICIGGALAMKKPVRRTVFLILIPVLVLPLEVVLMGALLTWLTGLRGIQ
jgi:hypothetical protein